MNTERKARRKRESIYTKRLEAWVTPGQFDRVTAYATERVLTRSAAVRDLINNAPLANERKRKRS